VREESVKDGRIIKDDKRSGARRKYNSRFELYTIHESYQTHRLW
jgi:hypothetical protein